MKKRVTAVCQECAQYNGGEWDRVRYAMVSLQLGECTICETVKPVLQPGYWKNISGTDAARYKVPKKKVTKSRRVGVEQTQRSDTAI